MNVAFNLSKDKNWREDDPLQPYKIVSLWEVLNFYAKKYANICRVMAEICTILFDKNFKKIELSQPILDELTWLHEIATELKMKSVPVSIERLVRDLRSKETDNSQIKRDAHGLLERIQEEFKGELMLVVMPARAEYYEAEETFLGKDVVDKLSHVPHLREEADEAGNCYALDRYTACVFHLMRIMEALVQDLAGKLRATKKDGSPLDIKNGNWYQIEQAICRAIEPMTEGDLKDKYTAILDAFSRVRARWRNPTMHPKTTYTAIEAKKILDAVQAFAEDFANL